MKNILDYLEITAKTYSNKIVFADDKTNITYSNFVSVCKQLATQILNSNLYNQPIAVFDNRNVQTLINMFAVLYSGNHYVLLDSHSPADRLIKILEVVSPKLIICEEQNLNLANEIKQTNTNIINTTNFINTTIDEEKLQKIHSEIISTDPAYILFTSGSTGVPKGTVCSHQNLITYIKWYIEEFDINSSTIFGSQTPFYFSASVSDLFSTICTGATFNIIPKSYFAFPIQLINFLNERKVNTIYWVPSALCMVANVNLFEYAKPEYIKKVLFIGEIMPNKQLNYWRKHLPQAMYVNLFGPTETVDVCAYYKVNRQFADDEPLPIGKHCNNCQTFIIDENGKEVTEQDKPGELYVRGEFVAMGYYNNPEKTALAFVQNPLNTHYPEKVYKTGDLVKLNQYGEYEYIGRTDFQIKHKGYRIELGEIETNVVAIKNVNSCVCVFDKEDDKIVLIYQGKISKEDLLEQIKTKVPQYMVPEIIIKVSQITYNQNGKIDRNFYKNNYKNL